MQTGLDLVELFTDGACSGNPGPADGVDSALPRQRKGAFRRRKGDDEQPHGAHRRDRRAKGSEKIAATSKSTQIHNMLPMQSPKDGPLAGGATAGGKQIRNPRSTRSCGRSC